MRLVAWPSLNDISTPVFSRLADIFLLALFFCVCELSSRANSALVRGDEQGTCIVCEKVQNQIKICNFHLQKQRQWCHETKIVKWQ